MIGSDSCKLETGLRLRISRSASVGLYLLCVVIALSGCAKPERASEPAVPQAPMVETPQSSAPAEGAPSTSRKMEELPEPSVHNSAPLPPVRARPDSELYAAETQSLAFARAVLEREGSRKLDAGERERVAKALVFAEIQHDLPVALSLAIIKQESRFDPAARGPSGSIGLMQLQPATAREIAERTGLQWTNQKLLRIPEVNVRLGLAYLAELRTRFENTEHAVGAYNIGPTKMRRLLARKPFRRGPYLTKVYNHAQALENEYSH